MYGTAYVCTAILWAALAGFPRPRHPPLLAAKAHSPKLSTFNLAYSEGLASAKQVGDVKISSEADFQLVFKHLSLHVCIF